MRAGDVMVSIAGTPVRNMPDLQAALSKLEAGKAVKVVVFRGTEEVTLEVTLAERTR